MTTERGTKLNEPEISQHDALLDLYPEIQRAANAVGRKWADVVDPEELAGDMSLHLLEKAQAVTIWGLETAQKRKVLSMVASQIASDQREALDHFHGTFMYSTDEVRHTLSQRALSRDSDYEVESGGYVDVVDGQLVSDTAIRINVDAIDLRIAFERIPKNYQQILLDQFDGGGYEGDTKDITRAVDALTREMNRSNKVRNAEYEGPGSRRVMSNSRARKAVRNDYGERG